MVFIAHLVVEKKFVTTIGLMIPASDAERSGQQRTGCDMTQKDKDHIERAYQTYKKILMRRTKLELVHMLMRREDELYEFRRGVNPNAVPPEHY
jgi:hypothetical protein